MEILVQVGYTNDTTRCVMAEMNLTGTNYAHIEHTKLPLVQSVMLNQI